MFYGADDHAEVCVCVCARVHKYSVVQLTTLRCVCVCVCACVCVHEYSMAQMTTLSYEKRVKGDLKQRPCVEVKETLNPFKRGRDLSESKKKT